MLHGVVLAGGQSRRMGQDKAMMQYKGNTLIQCASKILRSAGCQEILVSRNEDGYVGDKIPHVGPLGGVHGVLTFLGENKKNANAEMLVLPVDMPLMLPTFLSAMVNYGRAQKRACYVRSRFMPFYMRIEKNTIPTLEDYLINKNKRRVVGFLKSINALAYENLYDDNTKNSQWLNVNSPSDWPKEYGSI